MNNFINWFLLISTHISICNGQLKCVSQFDIEMLSIGRVVKFGLYFVFYKKSLCSWETSKFDFEYFQFEKKRWNENILKVGGWNIKRMSNAMLVSGQEKKFIWK